MPVKSDPRDKARKLRMIMRTDLLSLAAVVLAVLAPAAHAQVPAPPGAQVYFIEPADGATVKSPVTVKFGLKGIGVAPALVEWPNTGHHHLLVDRGYEADLARRLARIREIYARGDAAPSPEDAP